MINSFKRKGWRKVSFSSVEKWVHISECTSFFTARHAGSSSAVRSHSSTWAGELSRMVCQVCFVSTLQLKLPTHVGL